jgi:hypothetical protein
VLGWAPGGKRVISISGRNAYSRFDELDPSSFIL